MRLPLAIPAILLVLMLGAALGPTQGTAQRPKTIPQGPDLTVFFTGDGEGEITSCGCPKLDYGGTTRKAAFFDTLRSSSWDFLLVDAGGLAPYGPLDLQTALKVETLAKTMRAMSYNAVALGDYDLSHGKDFVDSLVHWLGMPVVASNYLLADGQFIPEARLASRGKTVGIMAILDPDLLTPDHAWLEVAPWEDMTEPVNTLRQEVDILVGLFAVGGKDRLREAAHTFTQFDLIIGSHRGEMGDLNELEGTVRVVGAPPKGRYLGRLDFGFDEDGSLAKSACNYLPVVQNWGRRRNIDALVGSYYKRLRTLVSSDEFIAEQTRELEEPMVEYVGNETCVSCHQPQHDQWAETGHALAKETLEKEGKEHVPECQTCHSTGAGFRTGFVTPALTPEKWQVGCESCHGPGAGHLADNKAPYGIIVEDACIDCHTPHDSPDFDYEVYFPKVSH